LAAARFSQRLGEFRGRGAQRQSRNREIPTLAALATLKVPNDPGKLLHHALGVLGADVMVRAADGTPSVPFLAGTKWR
jgi:hypothetical protein